MNSTCYKKDYEKTFPGLPTTCMELGMCVVSKPRKWRHDDRCIACDEMEQNRRNTTAIPLWNPLAPNECTMCDYTPMPDVPAPTPAPTIPASSYSDGAAWPRNWTSPDGALFIGWKHGGVDDNDLEASNSLTFLLSCPQCDSTGWVGIGVNVLSPDTAAMVGTSAVVWKIEHGTVREYELGSKNSKGVVPWGQRNHIDRIASDSTARRATFSIGIGVNPRNDWKIASSAIATDRCAIRWRSLLLISRSRRTVFFIF